MLIKIFNFFYEISFLIKIFKFLQEIIMIISKFKIKPYKYQAIRNRINMIY